MENIELKIGLEVIKSYKRLSYTPWYAFAEFVDNSTQAYFNFKEILDSQFKLEGKRLRVEINYNRDMDSIEIYDNSIGMSEEDLRKALRIGIPPDNPSGRSKYGLGLKTSACWFGNYWFIETSKLGDEKQIKVEFDVENIADGKIEMLPTSFLTCEKEKHFTRIVITKLNRHYRGRTIKKIEEYLSSMYRMDIDKYLILRWQNKDLSWVGFDDKFYITQENTPYIKKINFDVGDKNVRGWVGVLQEGSRKDAGFSIIQNNRVIRGWPSAYKPESVFGEGGSNDLINQRVVGELFFDGFAVSHTKDNILWEDDQEEILEEKLGLECADAMVLAKNLRTSFVVNSSFLKIEALHKIESELKSDEIQDILFNKPIPDERAIQISFQKLIESVSKEEPTIEIDLGSESDRFVVKVFFRNVSEFEPYLLTEPSPIKNTLIVILNFSHPFWNELKNVDEYFNFIRQCVYDGLSEWKAAKKIGVLNPDTVKFIKDSFLRLPYEIKNNMF